MHSKDTCARSDEQSKAHYYAKCKELAAAEKAAASPGDDPKAAEKVMQGGGGGSLLPSRVSRVEKGDAIGFSNVAFACAAD
jgi:hypothetical protein